MSPVATISNISQGKLSVRLHRSEAEVAELRPFWTSAQKHPNSALDHFLLICRLRREVISPCVFSVWQQDECVCVVAGRIASLGIQPRIGYLKMPQIDGRLLSVIYGGVLGDLTRPGAELLVGRIQELLANRVVDLASFSGLPEGSPLLVCLGEITRGALGVAKPRWTDHWELGLSGEPGFLVKAMKSKHRSWIRKKEMELQKAFDGRIAWRWYHQVGDVRLLCLQMETVAARTYQRGLDAGFKNDSEHCERLSLFAGQGTLRVMLLEIDGKPAAFWLGVAMRGTFYSEATGYAVELKDYEVGTQMFLRLVDELIREGISRFDFGFGDAYYKKRFGDRSLRETGVRLFGSTWRGRLLRAHVGGCEAADRWLRSLLQWSGFGDRLKQAWRRQLAKRARTAVAAASCPDGSESAR